MSAGGVAILRQAGGLKVVAGQEGKRYEGGGKRAGRGGENDMMFICEICARSFSSFLVR